MFKSHQYHKEAPAKGKRPWSPGEPSATHDAGFSQRPTEDGGKRARSSTGGQIAQRLTVHCVNCSRTRKYHGDHPPRSYYLDTPAMIASDHQTTALHGQHRLQDLDNYLDECIGFSIVVSVSYDCEAYHEKIKDDFTRLPMPSMPHDISTEIKPYFRVLQNNGPMADATSERLQLSETLKKALHAVRGQNAGMSSEWDLEKDILYPYARLYHSKHVWLGPSTALLETDQKTDLRVLYEYVTERLTLDYEKLEELSAAGMVARNHWPMLFRPDEVAITIEDGQYRAFNVRSCRLLDQNTLELDCWFWEYDGKFFRNHITIPIKWPSRSGQVAIADLSVYPVRHAVEGIESELRKRGNTFWSCRRRKYVNYSMPLKGIGSQLVRLKSR